MAQVSLKTPHCQTFLQKHRELKTPGPTPRVLTAEAADDSSSEFLISYGSIFFIGDWKARCQACCYEKIKKFEHM